MNEHLSLHARTQRTFGMGIGPQHGKETPAAIVLSIVAKNESPRVDDNVREASTGNNKSERVDCLGTVKSDNITGKQINKNTELNMCKPSMQTKYICTT